MTRRPLHLGLALLLTVGAVLALSQAPLSAAEAQDPPAEDEVEVCVTRDCLGSGTPVTPAVHAGASFSGPGAGFQIVPTGTSVFDGCYWQRVLEGEELIISRPDVASINLTGSTFDQDHWIVYCPRLNGFNAYTIFPVGDPPPTPIIQQMIQDAYQRTPVVAFNPITSPDGDENTFLITQAITFLWVDDTAWNTPVSATATLPLPVGPFSVTTTALPRDAYWSGGDKPIWCAGDDMHPYVFDIGGDDAQPSNCSMIYKHSSATHDNTVDLEVLWDVSYTCSNGACGGTLPDITTISTRPVTVGEIQAVASRPGDYVVSG